MRSRYYCPDCLTAAEHAPPEAGESACAKCGRRYSFDLAAMGQGPIEACAYCGNRAFFLQKDFDQRLGCALMGISLAIALAVGWRFGWIWFTPVLLSTVLVDWIVAARIRPVTICYRCDAEYRDVPPDPRHRAYDPHVAERYAGEKTLRRMR
jgi:DNA-directed RNA polymerase subunit RPC12/RpoP